MIVVVVVIVVVIVVVTVQLPWSFVREMCSTGRGVMRAAARYSGLFYFDAQFYRVKRADSPDVTGSNCCLAGSPWVRRSFLG